MASSRISSKLDRTICPPLAVYALWNATQAESPCASRRFHGNGMTNIGWKAMDLSNGQQVVVIGEKSIEDEEVSLVDGVLEGALGALGDDS
ncbi:hypothetical protein Tco_0563248 [Tanacetum coccineum]